MRDGIERVLSAEEEFAEFFLASSFGDYDDGVAGFARAYRFTFYASLLALVLGAMLPGWPGGWGGRASHHGN